MTRTKGWKGLKLKICHLYKEISILIRLLQLSSSTILFMWSLKINFIVLNFKEMNRNRTLKVWKLYEFFGKTWSGGSDQIGLESDFHTIR